MQTSIHMLLDRANLHIHTKPLTEEEINRFGTKDDEVPESCIEDCKRIVEIIKNKTGEDIGIGFAYDLWSLHSYRAFCGSFTKIEGVSDEVIYKCIMSLIWCAEKGLKQIKKNDKE